MNTTIFRAKRPTPEEYGRFLDSLSKMASEVRMLHWREKGFFDSFER